MSRIAMVSMVMSVALATLPGCKGDQADKAVPSEPAPRAAPAAKPEPAPAVEPLADAVAGLAPAPPLAPPLETQMGMRYISTEPLGFTRDGRAFAVAIHHDYFFGEELGSFNLDIVQVFDVWTHKAIAAFKMKIEDDATPGSSPEPIHRTFRRLAKEARPRAEWEQWKKAHPLVPAKASRTAGGGSFAIEVQGKGPYGSSITAGPEPGGGFLVRWSKFATNDEIPDSVKYGETSYASLPQIALSWTRPGHDPIGSVRFRPDFEWAADPSLEEEDGKAAVELKIRAHVSADGSRVLWTAVPELIQISHERSEPDGWMFVRTIGYQVKVVDAGAGDDHARRVAGQLERSGVPVTALGHQKKPTPSSKIYYRRDAKSHAERARDALPGALEIAKLASVDWVDVIVVLGEDAAPATP